MMSFLVIRVISVGASLVSAALVTALVCAVRQHRALAPWHPVATASVATSAV
jgi:hypothetical protein